MEKHYCIVKHGNYYLEKTNGKINRNNKVTTSALWGSSFYEEENVFMKNPLILTFVETECGQEHINHFNELYYICTIGP